MKYYILFCAQDSVYTTRSMIIPYDAYLLSDELAEILDLIRKASINYVDIMFNEVYHNINNLIFIDQTNITDPKLYLLLKKMIDFADGVIMTNKEECHKIWYKETFTNLANGYNHIKNYLDLIKMEINPNGEPMEIVESFLVLEKYGNNLYSSPFETPLEMYKYYRSEKSICL